MSLNESRGSAGGGGGGGGSSGGGSNVAAHESRSAQISADGNSTVTVSGRKSNWEVIEHYRNSGEPPALMATMSHTGVARIDSAKGDSSYAQHSYTVEDPASDDTQSTDESILKDHSDNWWNVLALCSRVFRYAAIEDF